jgi:hypothetical protein
MPELCLSDPQKPDIVPWRQTSLTNVCQLSQKSERLPSIGSHPMNRHIFSIGHRQQKNKK